MTDALGTGKIVEALLESEQRFRVLVETIALVTWETDPSGTLIVRSPNWTNLTGQICQTPSMSLHSTGLTRSIQMTSRP